MQLAFPKPLLDINIFWNKNEILFQKTRSMCNKINKKITNKKSNGKFLVFLGLLNAVKVG